MGASEKLLDRNFTQLHVACTHSATEKVRALRQVGLWAHTGGGGGYDDAVGGGSWGTLPAGLDPEPALDAAGREALRQGEALALDQAGWSSQALRKGGWPAAEARRAERESVDEVDHI